MHPIFVQISGFVAVLILLKELWAFAPLDRTVFLSLGVGLSVYLALIVVEATVRHIVAYAPPRLAEETAGARPSDSDQGERKSEPSEKRVSPNS